MTELAERLAGQTVRPALSLVNSVVTMDRQGRTDDDAQEPGRRLERYIKARWTRREGGIRKLAAEIGASPETVHAWFRGTNEPSMAHLRAIADKLGVRRAVLVAVLDGDPLPGETDGADLEERIRGLEGAVALLTRQAAEAPPALRAPRDSTG